MDDDIDQLAKDERLYRLLEHYQRCGGDDREAWHDRVMDWEGGSSADLVRWHGRLLAANWVEINTGATPAVAAGRVAGCYRVTAAGRQALKRALAGSRGESPDSARRPVVAPG
jgi:hypothetical protein